jgi:hypothetical protein
LSDYRSITCEASDAFTTEYRRLERRIERQDALRMGYVRAAQPEQAADAAEKRAEALDAQEDLLFNEMLRLWLNARQTDERLPELPESWEAEGAGRAIRISFYEIEAYRGI